MTANDVTLARIAENQSRFRQTNEEIELAAERVPLLGPIPFLCECSRDSCVEIVELSFDEYEKIREQPDRFLTTPGHQDVSVDSGAAKVVAEHDGYVVVDKIGLAGEIARRRYRELSE